MLNLILLLLATVLYAAYNLLVKQSSVHAEAAAVTSITATLALQIAAMCSSLVFIVFLRASGVTTFALPAAAYKWAILAGISIGAAEICYFYLYSGTAITSPVPVNIATPVIVGGTVVLATLAAGWFFDELIGLRQWVGAALVVAGVVVLAGR